ncbi:MAG: AraC family transcriptional regulator, partial [Bacteroidota bacterium]
SYIESMLFWLYNAFYLTITFLFIKKERQTDHWKEPVGRWLYRFATWLTLFLSINFLHEFFYSSLVPFLQSSNSTTLWLFPVKFASVGINLLLVYQAFAYQYPSFYLQKTAAEHIRLSSQTKEQLENIRAQLDLRLDYYLLFKEANDTKLAQKIKELFEEKQMHLDPELTLATFVKMTGYAQEEVVQFFIEQNTTFVTTLNQYRVVSFIEMAMQPTYAQVSILGIAYLAGFSSKAAFHNAFKVLKGESPKAYLAYRKALLTAK